MACTDIDGRPLAEGDTATVLGLPDGFLRGLPRDCVAFLTGVAGRAGRVDEVGRDAACIHLEAGGGVHRFLWLPGTLVRRLPGTLDGSGGAPISDASAGP